MKFREKYQSIIASETVRNATKLLSANVVAQAIGILIYPILTRIYAPEDFGLLNLFQCIGGFLVILSTAEYQYAILLPANDSKAHSCLRVGFVILIITTILCLLTLPFSDKIASLLNTPEFADCQWGLPLFILFSGGWQLLNYWHTRKKNYNLASTYQVSKSLLNAGLKWIFGIIGWIKGGLILATVLSAIASFLLNIARTRSTYSWKEILRFHSDDKETAREYRNFPHFSLPKSSIGYISSNLPFFMLIPAFGLKEMGYYGMAITLSFTPINLIYNAIYQVLFQDVACRVNQRQHIQKLFRTFIQRVICIALPTMAILFFTLPDFTELLLGEGWRQTGVYIQYSLPWLLVSFIGGSICFVTDVFMKQKGLLIFEFGLFTIRLLSILYGIHLNDLRIAVVGFCAGGFIINTLEVIWYLLLVKRYEQGINA